ncbi:1822_t:CDS:2 [Gigaspora margarita]|uniref:1822_t:CDS:1 n=1 Tax=Gigaspora margarita TaxID=4874 RepID=A0ABN7VUL5_GIGMA|nr:1822_t:CDS:2 [Gigaspora margarita]
MLSNYRLSNYWLSNYVEAKILGLGKDGNIKTMVLTSDSVASWILDVVTIRLKGYQQIQSIERPFVDIFQPNYDSRINSMIGTHVITPKYVNQQFALMMIPYNLISKNDNKATVEVDFEIMSNFSNF